MSTTPPSLQIRWQRALKTALAFAVLAALASCTTVTSRDPAIGHYKRLVRSAVVVGVEQVTDKSSHWYACSAVLVDKQRRLILTANHCLARRSPRTKMVCAYHPEQHHHYQLEPRDLAAAADAKKTCHVVSIHRALDIAILRSDYPLPANMRAVALATRDAVIGEAVFGVSAPHLLVNTWYSGYVNNRLNRIQLKMPESFREKNLFGFTTPLTSGASGSMVLDRDDRLLGIAVAVLYGMSTGIAVSAKVIVPHLRAARAKIDQKTASKP